jgi:hypothetical protein
VKRRAPHLPPGCVGFVNGCRLLGFSPATGERRLRDPHTPGLPPIRRLGRDRYFSVADILAFKAGLSPSALINPRAECE